MVIAQLTVYGSFMVWMLRESKVSIRVIFSGSASFVDASQVKASASTFCDLEIWLIVYELKDLSNYLAF